MLRWRASQREEKQIPGLQERAWLDPSSDSIQLWASMLEGRGEGKYNAEVGAVGVDTGLCNPV